MRITTINTIELSSMCQLACRYCVNRLMEKKGRRREVMSDAVFDAALSLVATLVQRNTQLELNMNGVGESTLDPQLVDRMRRAKEVCGPARPVSFCTNGIGMTDDLARALYAADIRRVDLSPHSVADARTAAIALRNGGINGALAVGSILTPHDWAGQLGPEDAVNVEVQRECEPLSRGYAYVLSNGDVVPCCYDYLGLGKVGTVFDEDLLERELRPFSLCGTCHQKIPKTPTLAHPARLERVMT